MNQNNFNNINESLSQNHVTNINEILNYINKNNLRDLGFKNQDHELILNPPYKLTLSLDSLLLPTRKNRKNKIPRPQNAWVLFRKDYEANKRIQFPDQLFKMKTVSVNAGDEWKIQSSQVKIYFEILSKLARAKHKIMYPDYKYTPKRRSSNNKDWVFYKTLVLGEDNQIKINQDDNSYEFSTTTTTPIVSQNTFTEFNNEFSEVDQPEHYYNDHSFMQFTSVGNNDNNDYINDIHDNNNDYINDIHDNNNHIHDISNDISINDNNNENNNDIHDNNNDIHDISNDISINDNNINENINYINYINYNINNNINYNIETPFINTFIHESFTEFNNIDMNSYNDMNSMNSVNPLNYSESMTITPTSLTYNDAIPEYLEYMYSDNTTDTVDAATEFFPSYPLI
ncbi:hypothetical protein Glove_615g21 [Diversispora epigaea]|uniref:HMG box domain-containing protein n=1 Tax=Diversispora epigaea TaxID=1348612 RepID=A0A397GAC5_9GLOM|nr:hypothetical protein Glove_615g21 [Diversispora epigaea]